MSRQTTAPRFLRIPEVLDRVGVSRPTIYQLPMGGSRLVPQANRLRCELGRLVESHITKWMDQRIRAQ